MSIEINKNDKIDVIVASKSRGLVKVNNVTVANAFVDKETKCLNIFDEENKILRIYNKNDWTYVDMIMKKEENDGRKTGTTD